VAIKTSRCSQLDTSHSQLQQLCNELRLLRRLRHPNIVLLYGACLDVEHRDVALVMELLSGVMLSHFLAMSQPVLEVRMQLLMDVGAALNFLHGRCPRIVHSDLKDSNVSVETGACKQPRAKLLDFGLSKLLTKRARLGGGTLVWMAPEQVRERHLVPAPSVDVYSFGLMVFLLVTGMRPHAQISVSRLRRLHRDHQPIQLQWPEHGVDACHRSIVARCCHQDPSQRPTIADVQGLLWPAVRSGEVEPPRRFDQMLQQAREVLTAVEASRTCARGQVLKGGSSTSESDGELDVNDEGEPHVAGATRLNNQSEQLRISL
jgi:mitogen-activated protein kinase kinase kinase 7